jgi:hypothetical protein
MEDFIMDEKIASGILALTMIFVLSSCSMQSQNAQQENGTKESVSQTDIVTKEPIEAETDTNEGEDAPLSPAADNRIRPDPNGTLDKLIDSNLPNEPNSELFAEGWCSDRVVSLSSNDCTPERLMSGKMFWMIRITAEREILPCSGNFDLIFWRNFL